MNAKHKMSDDDADRFERSRRKAMGKRRMMPRDVDDMDVDDILDCAFIEPTDEDLEAIEDDWEEEET